MPKKILLSIPAKNEESTLEKVIEDATSELKKCNFEEILVLVVDDGSTDNTKQIAEKSGAYVIHHKKSKGLGVAFSRAIEYALEKDADIVLTIDADNQFRAEDIPNILSPLLSKKADFVTGSRFLKDSKVSGIPFAKRIGNRLMSELISSILKEEFKDVSCGFRAYNKEALHHLNLFGKFTYTQEVFINLAAKDFRIYEVPITVEYFKERTSRIASSLLRYGLQTSRIIFSSVIHYAPMRLFGGFAIITFLLGFPPVLILGIRYVLTDMITPFKGIAISGIVLLVVSFASFTSGLVLQILSRLQLSIEKNIYYARKNSRK